MGRIKTKKIKRTTQKIFAQIKDKMTINFDQNKTVLNDGYNVGSKKLRNVIAGYCTRLKKNEA